MYALRYYIAFIVSLSIMLFLGIKPAYAWDDLTGGDHGGANWTISVNTEVAGVHTNIGTFTVNSGITATVKAYDGGTNPTYGNFEVVANSVNVIGTITSVGKGYRGTASAAGEGPGGGLYSSSVHYGGASHGGWGGTGSGVGGRQVYYGSIITPVTMGSAGGASYNGTAGGSGGGSIKITSATTFSVSGSITSTGGAGASHSAGGAGGSILLIADSFSGAGSITANGGTGNGNAGGGGGGRMAIKYVSSNSLSGTITANGGVGYNSNAGENGTLIYLDTTNNDIEIKRGQTWRADSDSGGHTYTFRNITVSNNATWTLRGYYTNNTDGVGFTFNVANFDLCSGCTIQTVGYVGAAGVAGPGPGGGGYTFGSNPGGGGYGGVGQTGNNPTAAAGTTYGSSTAPVHLGSAGGGNYNNTSAGGNGGGAIKITASGTVTVAGTMTSNGANAGSHAGGGSGGSIYIIAGTIAGSGNLRANGGTDSGGNGGGGGGGRIALYYSTSFTYSGTPTVTQGTGGFGGADGTYFSSSYPQIPNTLEQYESDGIAVISSGAATDETTVVLKIAMAAGTNATLTPQFEVREIGTEFSDTATNTGSSVPYTGSPATGEATVTGLSDATNYHWQARVCDQSSNCSEWVEAGGDPYDFRVFTNQTPFAPASLGPSSLTDGSSTNDTAPTFTFTLADPDGANEVYFTIQISADTDYDPALVEYVSVQGTQGSKTFTVGQTLAGGVYLAGSIGQTLNNGSYYWRVKTTDENGASSEWSEGRTGGIAFNVDDTGPTANATGLSFSNATDGQWESSEPRFTWTTGTDSGGTILGYCVSLSETAVGASVPTDDPADTGGMLEGLDDGVSATHCPFIATGTALDLSGVAGLTLTDNKHYYISIAAVDTAGNIYSGASSNIRNLLSFKYDGTAPTNVTSISAAGGTFSSVDDMYFSWPTSGGLAASDTGGSGLLGYQYSLNDQASWTGTTADSNTGLTVIPVATETPFNLDDTRDTNVSVGENVIYFRSVDAAGNVSSSATYRTASITYGGDAPSFAVDAEVTITPSTATENSFALSWDAASAAAGRTIETYYYMINTVPPATLETITDNPGTYFAVSATSVSAQALPAVVRGSNRVYVVAVDDLDNYSPSAYITATFTLNTTAPDAPKNLAVSDASIKSASLWRASLAWGAPDYVGLGNLLYTIQRSTDGTSWTTVGTTAGSAYVDTVTSSSKYFWRVGTADSGGVGGAAPTYSNAVTLTPKGTYTSAADLTSGPAASSITTKKATVTWTTSRGSDSKIAYGTASGDYLDEEPSNSDQVTDHTIRLTSLEPGTKYYYVAKWTDEDGNTGASDEKSFTTESAPVIKEVTATNVSLTSAVISFTAAHAAKVKMYYGKTADFGGAKEITTSTVESAYSVIMSELEDGTKYYYRLNGFDSEGAEYTGDIYSFETLPRPKVSDIKLQQVAGTAQSTVLVTWKSNTAISSIITVYPSADTSAARDIIDLTLKDGDHSLVVNALLPATRYTLLVKGVDKMGNQAVSASEEFTTASDTRPPAISNLKIIGGTIPPVGFAAGTINAQLVVTWDTDEPATSQVEFGEGTGSEYAQKSTEDGNLTTNHVVVVSGLTPSKVYHLRAISQDAAKNDSRSIDTVTIAPKATRSALDLVTSNLSQIFGKLSILNGN